MMPKKVTKSLIGELTQVGPISLSGCCVLDPVTFKGLTVFEKISHTHTKKTNKFFLLFAFCSVPLCTPFRLTNTSLRQTGIEIGVVLCNFNGYEN